jgi:hypothetical protein
MPTTSTLLNSHNPNYHEDDPSLERGWSSFACGEKKRGHRLLDLCVLTICTHTHTHTSAKPLLCCLQLDLLCFACFTQTTPALVLHTCKLQLAKN